MELQNSKRTKGLAETEKVDSDSESFKSACMFLNLFP